MLLLVRFSKEVGREARELFMGLGFGFGFRVGGLGFATIRLRMFEVIGELEIIFFLGEPRCGIW